MIHYIRVLRSQTSKIVYDFTLNLNYDFSLSVLNFVIKFSIMKHFDLYETRI